MKATHWYILGTLGALLVACGAGCGGGTPAGNTGAGGDMSGAAGAIDTTTGQGGDTGGGQAGDTGGGQAGDTGGGQAGTQRGFNRDAGVDTRRGGNGNGNTDARRINIDGGFNLDAILGAFEVGRGFDAGGGGLDAFTLPACAAGVANGGACTNNDRVCKPTGGTFCFCLNAKWICQ
jgi:hypothetical protein